MRGSIIVAAKLKGGSGATTTCREVAAAALAEGLSVAVIDLDGQGTLTKWWNRRTKGALPDIPQPELLQITAEQVPAAAAALRATYDLTVIDSPPSIADTIKEVACACDLALVPARATTDDLDAVGPIVRLLHGVTEVVFVQTQIPARSRDGADAYALLSRLAPVVGKTTFRVEYCRPPASGLTGYEQGKVAPNEIGALWTAIRERLGIQLSRDPVMTVSGNAGLNTGAGI